jgi:hypothetical protein
VQLDKTRIAIRERGLLEILDLALRVIRCYLRPLTVAWMVGVLPLMLLNYWLLAWMVDLPEYYGAEKFLYWLRYFAAMSALVFFETPLATIPMTLYLGDALFLQPTSPRAMARTIGSLFLPLFFCLVLIRGVAVAVLLVFGIERYSRFSGNEGLLIPLLLYALILRGLRPYLGEIILLEQNPLRAASKEAMTIGRRSTALHNPSTGDLMARSIALAGVALVLTLSLVCSIWFVTAVFTNNWGFGPLMLHVGVPLSMWIVAGYLCVVRFLSYLDLRIRREGWEVELRMRAEATRLARQLV